MVRSSEADFPVKVQKGGKVVPGQVSSRGVRQRGKVQGGGKPVQEGTCEVLDCQEL